VRVWLRLPNCWKLPKRRFLLVSTLLPDRGQLTRSLPVDIDVVFVVITVISPTGRGLGRSWHGWEKHGRGSDIDVVIVVAVIVTSPTWRSRSGSLRGDHGRSRMERRLVKDDRLRPHLPTRVKQHPVNARAQRLLKPQKTARQAARL
jgi:hypothetical protein